MSSATEWRSPLSILMGARRNDDMDLELREDYFRPHASLAPAAAAVAATDTNTATEPEPPPSSRNRNPPTPTSSAYGVGSYIPFRYFGLKSPAPPSYKNTPLHPPRGAFPPPIAEASTELLHEGLIEDGSNNNFRDDEAEFKSESEQDNSRKFIEYTPNFNHSSSHHTAGDYGTNGHFSNDLHNDGRNNPTDFISWNDHKAIMQTTFNFTNSIIGTSLMRLGGAFAASGGGISIIILIGFALLTKSSLDLVVEMSSCPSVIERCRSKERHHDRQGVEIDSQIPNELDNQSDDDSIEGTEDSRNLSNDCLDNRLMKTVNSSPLMATDENDDDIDGVRDAFITPTKTMSETIERLSLTEDVTQRRLSSHLHLDSNNSYKAETTTIEYNDSFTQPCGYEDVGYAAFGNSGRSAVLASKFLYAFGCLVAYVVVVRDNFGVGLRGILVGPTSYSSHNDEHGWLYDDNYLAFWVCAISMLPLSCSRTMNSLSVVSFVSILSTLCLLTTVAYMFFTCTNAAGRRDNSFYDNWIDVRSLSGVVRSLGCFAFTFVGHHTVNPAYESLPPPIRNPNIWQRISTNSMIFALEASLGVGVFTYLTFGLTTPTDVVRYSLVWCCM